MDAQLLPLIAAVERVLAETESEYGRMPFFVRPMVKRGFVKRTGHDFAAWRALLADARRGMRHVQAAAALDRLAEHYRGMPERAKRGMGASSAQLATIEDLARTRAEAAMVLRAALQPAS